MKKAIEMMQAMQNWLAQHEIISSITTTFGSFGQSCTMHVHGEDGIVADVTWRSYAAGEFEPDWAEFEKKVKDHFFGWWE